MDATTRMDAPAAAPQAHPNQFSLLRQRRFAPFFWTQFSGAANDNDQLSSEHDATVPVATGADHGGLTSCLRTELRLGLLQKSG